MKEFKETHQYGHISIESTPDGLPSMDGDLGVQVAKDGRVWVCIDGVAFLRFKPLRKEKENGIVRIL
ncbi:MAG: hypothetical protein FVQ80_06825 [Planctomycetes bacterium]|nr:hypothetical protein [Planctomycetota bacterium]